MAEGNNMVDDDQTKLGKELEHTPVDRHTNNLHPSKEDLADVEPGQKDSDKTKGEE